jgi:hypothetical protein
MEGYTKEEIKELMDINEQRINLNGRSWCEVLNAEGEYDIWELDRVKHYILGILLDNKKMKDYPELNIKEWASLSGKAQSIKCIIKRHKYGSQAIQHERNRVYGQIERKSLWDEKKKNQIENNYFEFDYETYLKTEYWTKLRESVLRRDNFKCRICNNGDGILQAHHRSYKWMWNPEKEINDLTTLCQECHKLFHEHSKLHLPEMSAEYFKENYPCPEYLPHIILQGRCVEASAG